MTQGETSLRDTWRRGTPAFAVDDARLRELVGLLFPGCGLEKATVLSGGLTWA
jgi:hypothetical protein